MALANFLVNIYYMVLNYVQNTNTNTNTFSATLAFKSASMNKLTLDPPNRILMYKIQMINVQKDYFSIIED